MAVEGKGHIGGMVYVEEQIILLWWLGGHGARERERWRWRWRSWGCGGGLFGERLNLQVGCLMRIVKRFLNTKMGERNNCWWMKPEMQCWWRR